MGGLYHKVWVVYEEERRDGEGIGRSCVITREGVWHSLLVWCGVVVKIKGNIVGGWMLFACLALSVVGNVVLMFGVGRKEGRKEGRN